MAEFWTYAPDPDEYGAGRVAIATESVVIGYLTPDDDRKLAQELNDCADHAEQQTR